jgi:hypothetical protein
MDIRTSVGTQNDSRQQLIEMVAAWAHSLAGRTLEIIVPNPPIPDYDVRVMPSNPRAAEIRLRVDTPDRFVVQLGRNSWWDDLPLRNESLWEILSAVKSGAFTEHIRSIGGRVAASRGELVVAGQRWTDSGNGWLMALPVGREQVTKYEAY